MTVTARTDFSPTQKVVFDAFHNDVIYDSEFSDIFQQDTDVKVDETGGGRYIEHAIQLAMGGGGRAIAAESYLSNAQVPRFANPRIYLKSFHDTLNLSGEALDRLRSGEEGWLTAMEQALPDLKNRMVHHDDAAMLGLGNGVKARIKASTTATVGGISFTASKSAYDTPAAGQFAILIDRPFGITGLTEAWRLFAENDSIVFTSDATAATPTLRNAGTTQAAVVTNIDEDNDILILTGDTALRSAVAAGDYIALGDASGSEFQASSTFQTMTGLYGAVDDGNLLATYMGVTRTNERLLKARVMNTTTGTYGGVLSEKVLERGDDLLADRRSKIAVIITSKSGNRQYRASLRSDRLFQGNGTGVGGTVAGQKGLQIILGTSNVNLRVSRKIPPEVTFGLADTKWKMYQSGDMEFDTRTGSMWKQYVDGTGRKHQYFADVFRYRELFCGFPGGNVRFDSLTKDA